MQNTTKQPSSQIDLMAIFKKKENSAFPFKPSNTFYQEIGVNKKRFAMICNNFSIATYSEMEQIAKYLKISVTDLLINN